MGLANDVRVGADMECEVMMAELDVRREVRFFELEQVTLAPPTTVSAYSHIYRARFTRRRD